MQRTLKRELKVPETAIKETFFTMSKKGGRFERSGVRPGVGSSLPTGGPNLAPRCVRTALLCSILSSICAEDGVEWVEGGNPG